MAVLTSTGVTFSDATSQATAFIGGRGQVFTTTGNFTVPTGVTAVKVTVVGGGGSGGNVTGSSAGGGGGGGGGVAIKFVTGLTPGGTVTVTVGGVAGTSSFGAHCSATGGATAATATVDSSLGAGGAGGAGASGDINITGSSGTSAVSGGCCSGASIGGWGGGSAGNTTLMYWVNSISRALGIQGQGFISGAGGFSTNINGTNGAAANGFGNGGAGAQADTATDYTGGAGSSGIVIVEF